MQRNALVIGVLVALVLAVGGIFWWSAGRTSAANAPPEVSFTAEPAFTVPGGATDSTGQPSATNQPEIPGTGPGTSGAGQ